MPNNDILRKMYKDGSLVSVVNMSQEGMAMPANIETWTLDDYGKPISIELKSGVTSISSFYQYQNTSLRKVVLPNTINTIGDNAFSNCNNLDINIPSGLTSAGMYVFQNSSLNADLSLPSSSFSSGASASGYSANWREGFNSCDFCGHTVTIENGVTVIPRNFARSFKNGTLVIPSSVTFLSPACFGCVSGSGNRTIIFLGDTPPNEVNNSATNNNSAWYAYDTSYYSGLTVIVPYWSFNIYKSKFPEVANYMQRAPLS